MMLRIIPRRLAAWTFAASLAGMTPAFAHAFLQHAVPRVGATVHAPPLLRLTFTEAVEPLFSEVTLTGPHGAPVKLPAAQAEEGRRQLVIALPGLQPGTYTVHWHVTSVDTHKTQGSFHFTVAP